MIDGIVKYRHAYGSITTTGNVVAGLVASTNGASQTFIFTGQAGAGGAFHIIYACHNVSGTWNTTKSTVVSNSNVDIEASANGSTVTFTFKAVSSTQSYTPQVMVEALGFHFDTQYLF